MVLGFAMIMVSCGDDDASTDNQLNLNLSGLEDLGSDYAYDAGISYSSKKPSIMFI